jgi:tartrate-resistant acid phosphatase type 5
MLSGIVTIASVAGCLDPSVKTGPVPEPLCAMSSGARPAVRGPGGQAGASHVVDDPDAGPDDESGLSSRVQFAVIGDFGLDGVNEARVANLVAAWRPDFVVTTGDNNYFEGSATTIDQNIGKYYCQFIGNYLGQPGQGSRNNRFWPCPGNHDWYAPNLQPYLDYFTLPGNERYYDVARGLVHLYSLDSAANEPDGNTSGSLQGDWLREKLAASTACFDVVFFHHPPYSSGPHGSHLEMLWPFEAWGADVVLAGHDHLYERFEVGLLPYFTVGLGGASIYNPVTWLPETRKQYHEDFGALRVTADRHGMSFEFVNAEGKIIDTYHRAKECP